MEVKPGSAQPELGDGKANGAEQQAGGASWRDGISTEDRRAVCQRLLSMLTSNKVPMNDDDKAKVEKLCTTIEQKLWASSKTKEEYTDMERIRKKLMEYSAAKRAGTLQQQQQQQQQAQPQQQMIQPQQAPDANTLIQPNAIPQPINVIPGANIVNNQLVNGGGNEFAVAGAPAGMSTAESNHRTDSSTAGVFPALNQTLVPAAAAGAATTAAATGTAALPTNIAFNQQSLAYMSNGAPVLLRGAAANNPLTTMQVQVPSPLLSTANVIPNTTPTSTTGAATATATGGVIKVEQQLPPAPILGMVPITADQPQQQQQQQPQVPVLSAFVPQSSIGGIANTTTASGSVAMINGGNSGVAAASSSHMIPLPGTDGLDEPFAMNLNTTTTTNTTMIPVQQQHALNGAGGLNSALQLQQQQQSGGGMVMIADPTARGNTPTIEDRKNQILKQQRWLLFLRHCAKCNLTEEECPYKNNCTVAKQLWEHIIKCKLPQCPYPRCTPSRELLRHHQRCTSSNCPVCTPVKQYVAKQREALMQRKLSQLTPEQQRAYLQAKEQRQQQMAKNPATAGDSSSVIQQYAQGMQPIVEKKPRTISHENMGTSLIEYFNQDQIRMHVNLLAAEGASAIANMPRRASYNNLDPALDGMLEQESQCLVCHQNKLTFEPPLLYCYYCRQRIKRNQTYYSTPPGSDIGESLFCHSCFTAQPSEIQIQSFTINKTQMVKVKNNKQEEEPWVQCDGCEGWVHQICGLFNNGRNKEERGYLCPGCLLHGLNSGTRKVPTERPQAMLTSKDLPRCDLSDMIEARLQRSIAEERVLRAKQLNCDIKDVPTADGLTVRVVNNVEKKLEVQLRFAEMFGPAGYPDAFLYKQKVILLFQEHEGVDMCLYCLYVQEYNEECPAPNNRVVYLSYLDSVKYLRPEKVEAAGLNTALRTMLYHDVLLGYCEYVKSKGYCSMYIWACPPSQGDDYIFYCHPYNRQKVPRSDRLREWYLTMLRRGKSEGIVTYISNLHDMFFIGGKDHRVESPSVTDLPYLQGDYWPGEAENLLTIMNANDADAAGNAATNALSGGTSVAMRKSGKDKRMRLTLTDAPPGEQLLCRLGDSIKGMKNDFIVAHFYESCSHCRKFIDGGMKYYCESMPTKVTLKSEKTFDGIALDRPGTDGARVVQLERYQLCEGCYSRESGLLPDVKPLGLPGGIELTSLIPAQCPSIPSTTPDTVPPIACEFFDTRDQFLSLCQGNHFQFDTLRRARHSSMMVLYHLHNPSEPAFTASCDICSCEIKPGEGWRCTVCPDFDECNACHNDPRKAHPHPTKPLADRKFDETRMRLTDEDRQQRDQALKRTMALLVHASGCQTADCPSSNCAKVKALFSHAVNCSVKIMGGCPLCRRMWALLQAHAKMCTAAECPVPRCRDLRQVRRQQMARQEEKRRAAYRKMVEKQNAADAIAVGGGD